MAGDAHLGGHPHDTKTSARALHVVARPREASRGKRIKKKNARSALFVFKTRQKARDVERKQTRRLAIRASSRRLLIYRYPS